MPLVRLCKKIQINIPPHSGGYFSFGRSPNTTGCAQVRFRLACQPCNIYLPPINGFRDVSSPPSGREVDFCEAKRRREPATIRKFVELPLSLWAARKFLLSNVSRPMAPSVTFGDSSLPEGAFGTAGARGVPRNEQTRVLGVPSLPPPYDLVANIP